MTQILDHFLSLTRSSPGNMIISVMLTILLAINLFLIFINQRKEDGSVVKRRMVAVGILLFLQVIILVIHLLVNIKYLGARWGCSSIERAFSLKSLVLIFWMWFFPRPNSTGDMVAGITVLFSGSLMLFLLALWMKQPDGSIYIFSFQDILWQIIILVFLIIVTTLLLIYKPVRYQFGIAIASLAGVGHLIYLIIPKPMSVYPAIIPIYQLMIFLILLIATGINWSGSKLANEISPIDHEKEKTQVQEEKKPAVLNALPSITPGLVPEKTEALQGRSEKERLLISLEPTEPTAESETFKLQLHMALEELACLQNELNEAKLKISETDEKEPSIPSITEDQVQMITTIAQELRQPMSSIVGYTDLIMGESVGILGALQRKFLERVKFSSEKVVSLIEDLIRITTNETDRIIVNPEVIDLNNIIDNAVAYTSAQLREKNITMRLDIPEAPPMIHIDREALQQILIHLLQNAGAATLIEGTIQLSVQIQTEKEKDFLLIQVVDSGGGIPSKDIPKVFARRYRADNVLIQGLGDTGVGLSITKALAEAQLGRIWVETSLGVGSTISVLLPIVSAKSDGEEQDKIE